MSVELMTADEKRARQAAAKEAEKRGDNPDQYWRNQRQLHTVGYLTTTAGALTAGYAEGWLTGAFAMPHTAFQFDIGQVRLGVVLAFPSELVATAVSILVGQIRPRLSAMFLDRRTFPPKLYYYHGAPSWPHEIMRAL